MAKVRTPRRPKVMPALVRGEPVVKAILTATFEELSAVGYEALCIENVAGRAGVNKTTVYRRWPTKVELVLAAMRSFTTEEMVHPDTGSLRGDLLLIAQDVARTVTSSLGRGLMRVLEAEEKPPELEAIAATLRQAFECLPRSVIEAAIARGELAVELDGGVLLGALVGAIHHRFAVVRKPVDRAFLSLLVALLVDGARSVTGPTRPSRHNRR